MIKRTGLKLEKFDGHVFVYDKHSLSKISSDIEWSPTRGAPASSIWPPKGLHLTVSNPNVHIPLFMFLLFQVSLVLDSNDVDVHDCLQGVSVQLHYQIYDGIPLIEKWLTVYSAGREQR